jgi:aminomethyltransferase
MFQRTALYEKVLEEGAKIIDFFGWALPLQYSGILKEARATRDYCGLFDISHMGEIKIRGPNAQKFLQALSSNDISLIGEGSLQYNLFITEAGTILEDLTIYNLGDSFLCTVNASNTQKVLNWLLKNKIKDVDIIDESKDTSLFSLQGPKACSVLEGLLGESLKDLKYMSFVKGKIKDIPCIISRSGYTGEDGFEIYTTNNNAPKLWDLILREGRSYNLTLAGLGARDILRIEAGYPLYGNDIDEATNPIEASLAWVVKLNKDFIGKDKILEVIKRGPSRRRVGFIMEERGLPRKDYSIYNQNQEEIGRVSSGTYSPNIERFIGMGYVKREYARSNIEINLKIRDKFYKAKVKRLPFIPYRHR